MGPQGLADETSMPLGRTKSSESNTTSSTVLAPHSQDGSEHNAVPARKDGRLFIDWTRAPVPGSQPYIDYLRGINWAVTPLGPMDSWGNSLRQVLVNIMRNPDPRLIVWGPERVCIYNEGFIPMIKEKHPGALGRSVEHAFSEVWSVIAPIIDSALLEGKTTQIKNMNLILERSGFPEETFWSFTLIPVIGDDGYIEGALDALTETSISVVNDRRMRTIIDIGQKTSSAQNLDEVWNSVTKCLETNANDIPFAILYSVSDEADQDDGTASSSSSFASKNFHENKICNLKGLVGISDHNKLVVPSFSMSDDDNFFALRFREAWSHRDFLWLKRSDGSLPLALQQASTGRADSPCLRAVICPVSSQARRGILAFLVLGVNSRTPYNEEYKLFLRLLGERINASATAVSLPHEQRQAQAAAEEAALRHATLSRQLLLRTQEVERSEAKFQRMAERVPVGMFMLRAPDYEPVYLNDKTYEITGMTKDTTVLWKDLMHPEDLPATEKILLAAVQDKQPATFEYRLRRPWRAIDKATGVEMTGPTWLLATLFPELESDGSVVLLMGWITDISLKKWTESYQERRLQEALEMRRQKENFIDMTSHELRNPLSAIVQSADSILTALNVPVPTPGTNQVSLLKQEAIDAAVEAAEVIMLCAQHQKRIVDDILTLSKLDSHLLVIAPDLAAPEALVGKALKMYEAELTAAGIDASILVDESYKALAIHKVVFDPSRLLQVLVNLLTNAIKFTRDRPKRTIIIHLSVSFQTPASDLEGFSYIPQRNLHSGPSFGPEWGSGSHVYLRFAVEDTGKGLTPEEITLLFHRFSQASPKTYATYGGSGLGLFISRELTELQGGQIGVCSKADIGSTFAFYVKALKVDPRPSDEKLSTSTSMQAELVRPPVRNPGKRENSGYPFPSPSPGDSRSSSVSGNPSTITRAPSIPPEQLHVLIVEDNLINQKVMASQLRRQGCVVYIANHGLEALAFLQITTFSAGRPPDPSLPAPTIPTPVDSAPVVIPLSVILLDLEMPIMDGLTCIRRIRQMEMTGELVRHVPVIAVTANARSEQIDNAIEHGMDSVITKPFRIPELMLKMEALVHRFDRGRNHVGNGLNAITMG